MLIAQITDCHVVARGTLLEDRIDTGERLRAAVASIIARTPQPTLVIATGDLVNDAQPDEYEYLESILADLTSAGIEILATPGNHDDRDQLRRLFPTLPEGGPHDPLDHAIERDGLRFIGFDTSLPGDHGGNITPARAAKLDALLSEAPDTPTLIFQHHPPFVTGIDWMDGVGLAHAEREVAVINRHRQVAAVVSGHIHRPITTVVGGALASCAPSTGAQVELSLDGQRFVYIDDVPQYALHHWDHDHGLRSHLVQVHHADRWIPQWGRDEISRTSED